MTAREVIERLTLVQRAEIAAICLESLDADVLYDVLRASCTDDELLELGLRIRKWAAN